MIGAFVLLFDNCNYGYDKIIKALIYLIFTAIQAPCPPLLSAHDEGTKCCLLRVDTEIKLKKHILSFSRLVRSFNCPVIQ